VGLTIDEVEALRLVDLDGLSHEEAAASLGVSRQTVGRALDTARRKVADALVNGKALAIGGGAYQVARARCCDACGWQWQVPVEATTVAAVETCPACGSVAVRLCTGLGGQGGRGFGACRGPRGQGRGRGRGCGSAPPQPQETNETGLI